jgi:hypothetical protein
MNIANRSSQFPNIPSSLDERKACNIPSTISDAVDTFLALKK